MAQGARYEVSFLFVADHQSVTRHVTARESQLFAVARVGEKVDLVGFEIGNLRRRTAAER